MNEELTVLVADDEPELLQAVCQLIDWQALGFRLVGRASNGLEALQLVEELQPDFLLTVFAKKLENACLDTVRAGTMTGDLAALCDRTGVTSLAFLKAVRTTLEQRL